MDVNGTHREGIKLHRFITHLQRRRSFGNPVETFEPEPLGVPNVTVGQRVSASDYRAILGAFAAPIGGRHLGRSARRAATMTIIDDIANGYRDSLAQLHTETVNWSRYQPAMHLAT